MTTQAIEDTAAPQADNAGEAVQAPPEAQFDHALMLPPESAEDAPPPESEPAEAPETETTAESEPTREEPEAPETPPAAEESEGTPAELTAEQLAERLAAMSEEELEALGPVAGLVNRRAESSRRRAESEAAQREQQWYLTEGFKTDLINAIRRDDNDQPVIDPDSVKGITDRMWAQNVRSAFDAVRDVIADTVPDDFAIPVAMQREIERVRDEVFAGRRDGPELIKAQLSVVAEAAKAEGVKLGRQQAREEAQREAAAGEANQRTERTAETRRQQARPTATVGGAGKVYANQRELEAAVAQGDVDALDVYQRAVADGSFFRMAE